jgi:hypothetical protein
MERWGRRPRRGECWESDRGIRAKVREVGDDSVVIELAEMRAHAFSMERRVFELTFKHLSFSVPDLPQPPHERGRN